MTSLTQTAPSRFVIGVGDSLSRRTREAARADPRGAVILFGGLAAALCCGVMTAVAPPKLAAVTVVVVGLVAAIALFPAAAAYLLIATTPLVAGINRGSALPALRPNEALLLLIGLALCIRAVVSLRVPTTARLRLSRLDVAILLLAVTSSVIPLAWLGVRGQPIEQDDVLYALMVWKYYAVFCVFRGMVRNMAQVRTCLWLSMGAAAVVAVLAILQSLQRFGVAGFLAAHYAPYGNLTAVTNNRGGSTLGLPIAVADLLTFNLAIAFGLLSSSRRRNLLLGLASLFVLGVFAAGEFSGLIALLLGVVAIAFATRRIRYLAILPLSFAVASYALRSVIDRRLQGFQSPSGLPLSWEGRLQNLRNYFVPQLFSHDHWVLGVRPAARVASAKLATGYIWIESGYVWLLWAGGLPLLGSFFFFLWAAWRDALAVVRARRDELRAAALAVVAALTVVAALMIIDPHLTYRGSADLLFALLGITAAAPKLAHDRAATT
jgi:hypothetical protein